MEFGVETVTTASSGNAGVSVSAYAAKARKNCVVFLPEKTPATKLSQIAPYGAAVIAVEGSYSNSFEMARLASQQYGWFNVTSTFFNPYVTEADKTLSFEIYEQLDFCSPDWIIIPVGAGPLLVGAYKGFSELEKLGLLGSCLIWSESKQKDAHP